MRIIGPLLAGFILAAIPLTVGTAAAGGGYVIQSLDATFELVPDANGEMRDVAVRLAVTYEMDGSPKSGGHKYVGRLPIRNLRVTDGEGRRLPFKQRKEDRYRISWSFPTVMQGQQTVIAQFVVIGVRTELDKDTTLVFDWIRRWPAPVSNATFRFLLPVDGSIRVVSAEPIGGKPVSFSGRPAFEIWRAELLDQPFVVHLETSDPGVAGRALSWVRVMLEKTLITVSVPVVIVLALLVAVLVLRILSRRPSSGAGSVDISTGRPDEDGFWRGD